MQGHSKYDSRIRWDEELFSLQLKTLKNNMKSGIPQQISETEMKEIGNLIDQLPNGNNMEKAERIISYLKDIMVSLRGIKHSKKNENQ